MHHIYQTTVSMSYFVNADIEESTVQATVMCRIERTLVLHREVIMNSPEFYGRSCLFEMKRHYYTVTLKDGSSQPARPARGFVWNARKTGCFYSFQMERGG